MKFRFLAGSLLLAFLALMAGCSFGGSNGSSQSGFLFVAAQGDTSLSSFSIDVGSGKITANGKSAVTGTAPSAVAMTPDGNTLFVANNSGTGQDGTVTAYSISADGTVSAAGNAQTVGISPKALAIDPGGKFLFVANQGTFSDCSANPPDNSIQVFSISGTGLTAVGSPIGICLPQTGSGLLYGSGPSALAITPDGKYLYVANQFNNTISAFSVDPNGNLAEISGSVSIGSPFTTELSPSALTVTPDGAFLYAANFGSNSISAFAICDQTVTTCADPNNPDGKLATVSGSPFSAGIGPVAMATTPLSLYTNSGSPEAYLYVADQNSNQISQYKISTVTGSLTVLSTPTISTGLNPVSIVTRTGTTSGTTTSAYVYVSNFSATSISVYQFDVTTGVLRLAESPVASSGNPAALAVK